MLSHKIPWSKVLTNTPPSLVAPCYNIRPALVGSGHTTNRAPARRVAASVSQAPPVTSAGSSSSSWSQENRSSALSTASTLPKGGPINYTDAESAFQQLLDTDDLDTKVQNDASTAELAAAVEQAAAVAMEHAYGPYAARAVPEASVGTSGASQPATSGVYTGLDVVTAAHLFLQRILYLINRLNHFWYDSLDNYKNERSLWLQQLRNRIEAAWQPWEAEQIDVSGIKQMSVDQVKQAVSALAAVDVDPPLSAVGSYISHEAGLPAYKHLLKIASLDGLTEASRQSRVCAGVANEIQCMIFKVLMEEYGTGRLPKKHSTFFKSMMEEVGLDSTPEHYLDLVPWQALACANHNFFLTEKRRNYLRYAGALTFFEVAGPSIYKTYLSAANRLGLNDVASGYWALHIKEDERHGAWMVQEVAVPLADKYPADAWEILLGYEQDKYMGARAGAAVMAAMKGADAMAAN